MCDQQKEVPKTPIEIKFIGHRREKVGNFFDGTGFGVKFRKYFSFDFLGPLDGDKLHVPNLGLNSSLRVNLIKY